MITFFKSFKRGYRNKMDALDKVKLLFRLIVHNSKAFMTPPLFFGV